MAAQEFRVSFRYKKSDCLHQSQRQMVVGGSQLPNNVPTKINRQAEIIRDPYERELFLARKG